MDKLKLEIRFTIKPSYRRMSDGYVFVTSTFGLEVPALKATYNLYSTRGDTFETRASTSAVEAMNKKLPAWLKAKGVVDNCYCDDYGYGEPFFLELNSFCRCGFGYRDHTFQTEVTREELEAMESSAFQKKLLAEFDNQEKAELAELAKARPEWTPENVGKWLEGGYYNYVKPESLIKYFEDRDKREIGADNAMKLIQAVASAYAWGHEPDGLIERWAVDDEDKDKVTRELQFGSVIPSSDTEFIDYFRACADAPLVHLQNRYNDGLSREERFYKDLERFNKEGTFNDCFLQFAEEEKDLAAGKPCKLAADIERDKKDLDLAGKTADEIFQMAYALGIKNGMRRSC